MEATHYKILIGVLMCVSVFQPIPSRAQSQELQQLLLDIEKLTQMKSILADMKTGYQIYQQGYGTISSLSKANFELHDVYLTGLLAISPTVRKYGRIAAIISMQASLVSEYKSKLGLFRRSRTFSINELDYMSSVYSRLASETLNDAENLTHILTAGELRMSDADRIKSIDRIYSSGFDRLQFLRSFNNQGIVLSLQRTKEVNDNQNLKRLYGINQ
ncbi:TerB family tellurite resistance protein [Mucilaginibacter sabulilitoris]|uniref:TerB family tellurite resistance protein n=1 Tax=Mucilaginibacter sabulilitoris TaxID=1173583 RepID=A0ABZ0TQU7_9SPHI|nr:TerB family tellurite resistance protein [Mucilaginibacter sabulilitoris]WPU94807.1 TerB family tellurite resistance protein [Mucilaginibacter sabulilitoris]